MGERPQAPRLEGRDVGANPVRWAAARRAAPRGWAARAELRLAEGRSMLTFCERDSLHVTCTSRHLGALPPPSRGVGYGVGFLEHLGVLNFYNLARDYRTTGFF